MGWFVKVQPPLFLIKPFPSLKMAKPDKIWDPLPPAGMVSQVLPIFYFGSLPLVYVLRLVSDDKVAAHIPPQFALN